MSLPPGKRRGFLHSRFTVLQRVFPDREHAGDLAKRIQESCMSLLTTLVETFDSSKPGVDRGAKRKAEESVEKLEQLVRQANADGLLTSVEARQLDLEFQAVKKSFHM